jgi:hypothetical protein
MNSDFYQEYLTVVNALAAEYNRRYAMVETGDIAQTLWMWFVTHPNKYKEWSLLEQKDRDKLIAKSLRNAAITFCEKEKAKVSGYEILDLYYYDASVIEAFLPSIISESYEIPQKIKDLNFKFSKGETNDGNNWLVLRADIAAAYYKLSEAKQNVLRIRFSADNQEWSALASELNTTPDGARMKVQRAINSLIKILGGFKPRYEEDTVVENAEEEVDE